MSPGMSPSRRRRLALVGLALTVLPGGGLATCREADSPGGQRCAAPEPSDAAQDSAALLQLAASAPRAPPGVDAQEEPKEGGCRKGDACLIEREILVDTKYFNETTQTAVDRDQYAPGYALEMHVGGELLSFEVTRRKGGLIQAFKLGARSIVLNRPWADQLDGSIFWPSPQSTWGWPPPPEVDPVPVKNFTAEYSVTVDERARAVTLTSPIVPSLGIQITKRFSIAPSRRAIVLDYDILNVGNATRSLAPWEITRVPPGGLTFYTTGAEEPTSGLFKPLAVKTAAGATWFVQNSSVASDGKLFADTGKGWLAHSDGSLLLVKCFEKIAVGAAAPTEQQVEVFDGRDYVEVELQGAFKPLEPGESLRWQVLWYLRRLPWWASPRVGDRGLLAFVRSLCSETASM